MGTDDLLSRASGRVLVQGITGTVARRHTQRMIEYGTNIVAGVTPGRGGQKIEGVPVFDTVAQAVAVTGADVSVALLPPPAAADGLHEAAEAGLRLCVCTTEGVPVHALLPALERARLADMLVVGPNSPGMLLPGRVSLGFLPGSVAASGSVALVSRSGTLSYEVAHSLAQAGLGESVWIGVGGDRIKGLTFRDILPSLLADPATSALALVGEIGGQDEEDLAGDLAGTSLACVALIAGRTAPADVPMGHAGAFVGRGAGGYPTKVRVLQEAGIGVARSPDQLARLLREALGRV